MTNKYGDKGSPCLIPLCGENTFPGLPLISTKMEVNLTKFITTYIHLSLKPILPIVALTKSHSILLYTLLMSSFNAITSRLILIPKSMNKFICNKDVVCD